MISVPFTDMESLVNAKLVRTISGTDKTFISVRGSVNILEEMRKLSPEDKKEYLKENKEYFDNLELSEEYQDFRSSFDMNNVNFRNLFMMAAMSSMEKSPLIGGGASNDELASCLGGIGKRIDEAYSQGLFTKEEYYLLNQEFEKFSERVFSANERFRAWRGEYEKLDPIDKLYGKEKSMMQIQEEMNDPALSKRYDIYRIDREMIWNMINKYRYGIDVMQLLNSSLKSCSSPQAAR